MAASPEGLCKRCGQCCYAKVIMDDQVYYTDIPCRYLDPATHLCSVYHRRFEVEADCLSIEEGIRLGVFPADCPYVKDIEGYRAPRTDCDAAEMGRIYRRGQ